jgi:hypothetical protein
MKIGVFVQSTTCSLRNLPGENTFGPCSGSVRFSTVSLINA